MNRISRKCRECKDHDLNLTEDTNWGKGFVDFSPAAPGSYAYVAQYVNKKAIGAEQSAKDWMQGREPEFRIMSKGIGEKYLKEHMSEILKTDNITCAGGRQKRPPRYFDKLLDKDTSQDAESYFKAHSDELREVRMCPKIAFCVLAGILI